MSVWEKFNLDSEPKFIWKYFTIDKFLDFILNNRIWVSRLDKFEDQFEAITNQDLYYHFIIKQQELSPPNNPRLDLTKLKSEQLIRIKQLKNLIEERQKKMYAACFYVSDEHTESMAMWKIYSSTTGVLLRLEYDSFLKATLSNISPSNFQSYKKFFGMIDYVPIHNFSPFEKEKNFHVENVGFKKDMSYQHENEFRLLFSIGVNEDTELVNGFYHAIDISKLKLVVITNPFVEQFHFENLKETLKQIKNDIEIVHSSIKRFV